MADKVEQRILITQATPGMVLSRPIALPNRTVLCGAGVSLSAPVIQRLTLRGIKRIYVRGQPLPTRSQEPLDVRLKALRWRFSRVRLLPLMSVIERAIEREMERRP